jgi:hypothetical protein
MPRFRLPVQPGSIEMEAFIHLGLAQVNSNGAKIRHRLKLFFKVLFKTNDITM